MSSHAAPFRPNSKQIDVLAGSTETHARQDDVNETHSRPPMKIREIRATPVNVDYREPERWSQGHRLGITGIVIEIETEDGLVGLGESVPAPSPEVTLAAIRSVTPLLVGQDPRRVTQRWRDLQSLGGFGA